MKLFTCLIASLCGLSLQAQSISLIPSVCDEDTALVSVSVGSFSERVTYSATLAGEPLDLLVCINGSCSEARTVSESGIDTITITHDPNNGNQFDDYSLNLQLTDGFNWWVSQPLWISGSLYPVIPSCSVVLPSASTGTQEVGNTPNLLIGPNPFTDRLDVVGKSEFIYSVSTLDGKLVVNGASDGVRENILGSQLAKGMYILTVVGLDDQTTTTRIVRE